MLISHRNMLSIYLMRNMDDSEGQWVNTESFEGGFIREVLIKKRDK